MSLCERKGGRERERERESYLEVVEYYHRQVDDKNTIFLLQVQFIFDQRVVTDTYRLPLLQNETTVTDKHN